VVTTNADADVALLKLVWLPKDMQVARLADSDQVRIGEQVFVVGAPVACEMMNFRMASAI